ncbi:MAG TPA: hypothetical protein VE978_26395 [Chitinophagales bacterium]|nr:hypothetical protein [Chitinophagales bacterium]
MKSILVAAVLIIASLVIGRAQNPPSPQGVLRTLKLESACAQLKFIAQDYTSLSFDEISQFAKNPSQFTTIDLSDYHPFIISFKITDNGEIVFQSPSGPVNDDRIRSFVRYNVSASFSMLNHKTNEYRNNRELQFGLFYQPWRYHQSPYARIDTITSDSLQFNYAYYDEWSPMLGVQGAYLFRTNPDKWINAYAGAGFGIGASVHPQIAETFGVIAVKNIFDTASTAIPRNTFHLLSNTQNIFPAKPSILLEGRIPFGVDFKIIRGLNLFLEAEAVASKQIYLQNAPSFPVKISFAESVGLKLNF